MNLIVYIISNPDSEANCSDLSSLWIEERVHTHLHCHHLIYLTKNAETWQKQGVS